MDETSIRDLLRHLQIPHDKVTYSGSADTRWMTISCPFAAWTHQKKTDLNPSFGITVKPDGRSHYKCLSCGMKGSLAAITTRLGGYRKRDYSKLRLWAERIEIEAGVFRPVVDWEQSLDISTTARNRLQRPSPTKLQEFPLAAGHPYLQRRGIRWDTAISLGLRYDPQQRRILFPIYDADGQFCGLTGRSTLPSSAMSKQNPKVRDYFGLNKREVFLSAPPYVQRKPSRPVICEGLFDYAKLFQIGYNAMAILGTALTPEKISTLVERGEPVCFFMDNDLAGWQALFGTITPDGGTEKSTAWAYSLHNEIPVWIAGYGAEFDGQDPGSLSTGRAHAAIQNARLFAGKSWVDRYGNPNLLR